jgi:putative ABC transport system permease protein
VEARLVKRVTESEGAVLTKLQALIYLVTAIVLLLIMICVATTMMAVVAERRKEIGLKKALGAANKSLVIEFMGEGIFLGAAGGVLGAVFGFIFAQEVSLHVFSRSISFRPLFILITLGASVAITALACLLPVRSATEVDPAIVLRGE